MATSGAGPDRPRSPLDSLDLDDITLNSTEHVLVEVVAEYVITSCTRILHLSRPPPPESYCLSTVCVDELWTMNNHAGQSHASVIEVAIMHFVTARMFLLF